MTRPELEAMVEQQETGDVRAPKLTAKAVEWLQDIAVEVSDIRAGRRDPEKARGIDGWVIVAVSEQGIGLYPTGQQYPHARRDMDWSSLFDAATQSVAHSRGPLPPVDAETATMIRTYQCLFVCAYISSYTISAHLVGSSVAPDWVAKRIGEVAPSLDPRR